MRAASRLAARSGMFGLMTMFLLQLLLDAIFVAKAETFGQKHIVRLDEHVDADKEADKACDGSQLLTRCVLREEAGFGWQLQYVCYKFLRLPNQYIC